MAVSKLDMQASFLQDSTNRVEFALIILRFIMEYKHTYICATFKKLLIENFTIIPCIAGYVISVLSTEVKQH